MPKTSGKIHMYDMVKIDTIFFEMVGGGGALKDPPPQIVSCLKKAGSDRVNKQRDWQASGREMGGGTLWIGNDNSLRLTLVTDFTSCRVCSLLSCCCVAAPQFSFPACHGYF